MKAAEQATAARFGSPPAARVDPPQGFVVNHKRTERTVATGGAADGEEPSVGIGAVPGDK